jgi:hypothetical protein
MVSVWNFDPRVCYTIKGHACDESASYTNCKPDVPCDVKLLFMRLTDLGGWEMSDYKQMPGNWLRHTIVQQSAGIA